MKKILFTLLLFISSLYSSIINEYPSLKLIEEKTPIVDIRTPGEWIETGILKNAIPLMFFDERGRYDVQGFLTKLNEKVDTTKPFALICRTGSRTKMLSMFLSKELGYQIINLEGGMMYAKGKNLPITPYNYSKFIKILFSISSLD